jgi:hypothetical protein
MLKNRLRFLKKIWVLNFFRRIYNASKYYNNRYLQIVRWGFDSKEDTNFTYDLTERSMFYLCDFIAVITNLPHEDINAYFHELKNNSLLIEQIKSSISSSDEGFNADINIRFGKRLGWYAFVRALKPTLVVETGVDKGLGSVVLCEALLKNREEGFSGEYIGTDINPNAGYLLDERQKSVGRILYGDSIESLKTIENSIDLFINDSDHSSEYEYNEYLTINSKITDRSILIGDNAHVTDKLLKFSREMNRNFLYFQEVPENHWYPGGGIGVSYKHRI